MMTSEQLELRSGTTAVLRRQLLSNWMQGSGNSATAWISFQICLARYMTSTLQNIGFPMWQHGNTGVMMLPTALSFHICGHFSALLADTPSGMMCNGRARWRSIC
eukprot:superscaffoldBa00003091_g16097